MAAKTFCTLISVAALCGCAAQKEDVVGAPPPNESVGAPSRTDRIKLEKAAVQRPTNNPEALVTLEAWPWQEEGRRFSLYWNSGSEPIVLADVPSLNSLPVAEATFKPGELIRWTQTMVGVYRPSIYRVTSPVEMEGYEYGTGYRTGNEQFYAELKKGEQVFVYHYLGSGLCLVQARQKVIEALCPTKEHFTGNFRNADPAMNFQPAERIWWVFLGAGTQGGWMPVDDRIRVEWE